MGSQGGEDVGCDLLAQILKAFHPPFPQHLLLLLRRGQTGIWNQYMDFMNH